MGNVTEMTCIVCPNSCRLTVEDIDGKTVVSGNKCKRGIDFAIEEVKAPKRTICSTVATAFDDVPVVPVKVSGEIPKSRMFDVMKEINKVYLKDRLGTGDAVIRNVSGLGVDVVLTSNILKGEEKNEQ